ncbi:PaaI family thioesterase [Janthinobacterium sp. Mn2066]|uniref:PaaI family thioesterase n=1 Tax=Janthinobacterium sp. Mn2066 TaxID=3395264 RepID=UPI003BE9BBA0
MHLKDMTGLQLMQAFAQGKLPGPAITTTMPMDCVEAEHGRVLFTATANETHTNAMGGVHGGFAATILDSVTGCATHTVLGAGETYATTDLSIKMCRPLPFNKAVFSEGKVINAGRNLVISEGYIRDEAGKVFAHATATCMIIRPASA